MYRKTQEEKKTFDLDFLSEKIVTSMSPGLDSFSGFGVVRALKQR
jgi:hypothetical protein